jgi:GH24 family phage-related lysozyme (muramidase)
MRMNREGDRLLDLYRYEFEPAETKTDASKAIQLLVKHRLNSNQCSALVCLICGISIDTFKESPLRKILNRGDMLLAAEAFMDFIHVTDDAGRRVIDPPTLKHRELQRDLFLKPELVRRSKRSICR